VEPARGALVAEVTPGSPAAKAGIERGDVLVTYDGRDVEDHSSLPMLVAATPVGKPVEVGVVRNGKRKTLRVVVARLADEVASTDSAPAKAKWGLALRELSPDERARLLLEDDQGVLVAGVAPGSPAGAANIEAGDVILQVNRAAVGTVEELRHEAAKVPDGKPLLLLVRPSAGGSRFAALAAR
jgi:serine protease Do